ncbi:MAG: glycosyltransferase [Ignavibacteriales bacterium]|nr:glycosyltransferase [Ignavibacteriales bacterium]
MKITAVVVTYNRLELLKQCIESIRNQTQKLDKIIVVNNDSIDGTFEWLNSQEDITHINQKNLGGAGGFYTGIKTAYNNGFDWIWCMDDDGLPEINALENLLGSHHIAQVKGTNCSR